MEATAHTVTHKNRFHSKNSRSNFGAIARRCSQFGVAVAACAMLVLPAHAVTIDFDDLAPYADEELGLPTAVTDQYAALGVTFGYAAVGTGVPGVFSSPNGVTDYYGPGLEIYFSGALPTSVSFYLSSFNQDSVGIDAYGPGGYITHLVSDGWRGTEENSTPYRDHQLISLSGTEISQLNLNSFYDRRGSLIIDNLTFTRDIATVSEPGTLGLLSLAIALLWLRRRVPA